MLYQSETFIIIDYANCGTHALIVYLKELVKKATRAAKRQKREVGKIIDTNTSNQKTNTVEEFKKDTLFLKQYQQEKEEI